MSLDLVDSHAERLVFAATQVAGSTKACAARGDAAMFDVLRAYYALAAEAVTSAGGRFIKPIGDSVLMTFPLERAAAAIEALRGFQGRADELWRGFDDRCRVQIKVGAGTLRCGQLGPPGAERFDIVGDALNALFKSPWSGFSVTPDVTALLE